MAKGKANDVPETEQFEVTGPINIKGVAYSVGDKVMLTQEEYDQLVAAGVPIAGVEPLDEEAIQAKHDEGVEAQKQRIEEGPAPLDDEDEDEPQPEHKIA